VEDVERFRNEFRDGYNECFPQKKVKIRKIDIRKPWLDDDSLKGKVKERNQLYALNLKTTVGLRPNEANQLRFLTTEVGHLRKSLKKEFFVKELSGAVKNSRAGKVGKQCASSCRTYSCNDRIVARDS
jgi:hypothetical protein